MVGTLLGIILLNEPQYWKPELLHHQAPFQDGQHYLLACRLSYPSSITLG